jgi:proline iminopeptidase
MLIEEGTLEIPDGKIWYGVAGEDAPGTPLVVLSGGPGAPHDYLENLSVLADERPVIFYDQLGCGRSDRPDDSSLWQMERSIRELQGLLEALGLSRVHLLGQSWGSMLAVQYLLDGRDRVERMALSAPLVSSPLWIADQRRLLQDMPSEIRRTVLEAEAAGAFDSPEYGEAMMQYYRRHLCRLDPWPESLQRTFEGLGFQVYLTMWGPSEFTCTGNLKNVDLTPRLKEIAVPVLFTCGRYDEAAPETVRRFSDLVPGSRLLILERASHMHHLEREAEYLSALRGFLRG